MNLPSSPTRSQLQEKIPVLQNTADAGHFRCSKPLPSRPPSAEPTTSTPRRSEPDNEFLSKSGNPPSSECHLRRVQARRGRGTPIDEMILNGKRRDEDLRGPECRISATHAPQIQKLQRRHSLIWIQEEEMWIAVDSPPPAMSLSDMQLVDGHQATQPSGFAPLGWRVHRRNYDDQIPGGRHAHRSSDAMQRGNWAASRWKAIANRMHKSSAG